ncbi:YhcN/YlaJ family sporulation lipoprotein [Anaerobacillus alkaliphilus]|uniref:YhcN/YlaJ family sporulation lipoprotein n=1 Tax=Anaerobacillus alkaliphilus TaxID=1548597 RepID=A0A4Q0VPR4_9BACI|nr:YhcN/YlaJ family sporulation lipoprotein [Anaerobacillus alkaliphilus]RXI98149.1 YhcN/YlaJ family sporulation lipoprotein [Anaerobacillus alkaliphilus]
MKTIQFCIYAVTILLLFGCQQNIAQDQNAGTQQPLGIAEQARDPREKEFKNAEEVAEHLVHLTERLPEVNSATAVVLGDLAVVGIDVKADLDRSDVGVVKYEVAEALSSDPHGAYAFVTADPDINARLKEMRKEINAGHPVGGIMNELAGIVGRLMPVIPGPEHRKSEPEPTDANTERLSEGQDQELENIQEEQGKRNMDNETIGNQTGGLGTPNGDGSEMHRNTRRAQEKRKDNSN